MAYITRQQMVDRYGLDELIQLTDRNRAGLVDDTVLDEAMADATAEVDGYVAAAGHEVPLSPAPSAIQRITADIARYRLYDDAAPQQVRTRYDDAVRFLRDLAAGKGTLGTSGSAAVGSPGTTTPGRTFTRDDLGDYG